MSPSVMIIGIIWDLFMNTCLKGVSLVATKLEIYFLNG